MFKKSRALEERCAALVSELAASQAENQVLAEERDQALTRIDELASAAALADTLRNSAACIEFDLNGNIIEANDAFLGAMGYSRAEIVGKRHRMFVTDDTMSDQAYTEFWNQLRSGNYHNGQFLRHGKNNKPVWVHAMYGPIHDQNGRLKRVAKVAWVITEQKQHQAMTETLLRETTEVMAGLAQGDLTHCVEGKYTGAFADLSASINRTIEKFCEITADIRRVAKSVDGGANAISSGNLNLSQRTEQQAASLAQTSANMETMTHSVTENAQNARTASDLAIAARDKAQIGGDVVAEAVEAMTDINESSKKIGDITGVIDEIAFQTNLLALNAAVEAARAGEHGRGFSVVASEVRSLAGRSATAAKEIKALITDSSVKVSEGTRLVNQSGATLTEIVDGVREVTNIVGQIATASENQSTGIKEVNDAVKHMDQLTQQNTALVEEAAASSEELSEQAQHLGELTDFFTTVEASPSAPVVPTSRRVTADTAVERRSADRPWSNVRPQTTTQQAPSSTKISDTRTADTAGQWNEF